MILDLIHHNNLAVIAVTLVVAIPIACATPRPLTKPSEATSTPVCLNLQNCTNVNAWGLQVTVSGQDLCLVPSTVINATYVIGTKICGDQNANSTCQAAHGGLFDVNAASGFTNRSTGSSGEEGFWNSLNGAVTTFGDTQFSLAGFTQLKPYEIGVVTNGTSFNVGQLGIGPRSSFLQALKDQGFIDRLVFGLDAGSQSPYDARPGNIVLGGYDQSRVAGNFVEFDINYEDTEEFRPCPFRVEIEKVDVIFDKDATSTAFIDMEARNPYACIEPYDTLFRFPSGRLASLESIGLGAGRVPNDWLPDLQVNEPGWRYNAGSPPPFSLNVVLKYKDEGFKVVVPNQELAHPLRGINNNGTYAINKNYTELNVFQGSAVRNTIVLGKAFLSQVYMAVDYDAGKFYLAGSSPSLAGCNPIQFGNTNGDGKANHSNKIAGYVGLAVAGVTLLIVIGMLGFAIWFWKSGRLDRYRRRGVNVTEIDPARGTYVQQNTKNLRILARQASCSATGSPEG